ncbi:MAG: Ni/Fe hydrogenase subunit alpha [Coriobacteriaceae bacterium]|nr:Ni/Fe hydrogenase subunit alpha [Coriobacteriaceae bacterium]
MAITKINVDHIARVEGHGNIHLVIKDGVLETVEMNVVEAARFFEAMVVGRSFRESSYICSRVCGICSPTHVVTDLQAIERIFGVEVSERTKLLRQLLIYGSYLQNHASHLFVFAVPDFIGQPSVFPLADIDPALFSQALGLKRLGNDLCTVVGGRSIHPITAVVGGFTSEPARDEYLRLADAMEASIPFAEAVVDLFNGFAVTDFKTRGDILATVEPGGYPVQSSNTLRFLQAGEEFDSNDRDAHIEEYKVEHSGAYFSRVKSSGRNYMTSSLARINASWDNLSKPAKIAAAKAGLRPPELNPMRNNVAQAVELVDALVRCVDYCRELAETYEPGASLPVPYEVRAGKAIGVTEAPRGVAFHGMELDDEGRIVHASIMTPTCQNLANMEDDIRVLAEKLLAEGVSEDFIRLEVEKLVRAYDPCLSCSVH